jgi:hypothetical protein
MQFHHHMRCIYGHTTPERRNHAIPVSQPLSIFRMLLGGGPLHGGQVTTIYGPDRDTVSPRRRALLPFVAVQKIPKRCVLRSAITGGITSGGSVGGPVSAHGRVGGLRVRAIRIKPESVLLSGCTSPQPRGVVEDSCWKR